MSTIGKICPIQQGVKCSEQCAWLVTITTKPQLEKSCAMVILAEDVNELADNLKGSGF